MGETTKGKVQSTPSLAKESSRELADLPICLNTTLSIETKALVSLNKRWKPQGTNEEEESQEMLLKHENFLENWREKNFGNRFYEKKPRVDNIGKCCIMEASIKRKRSKHMKDYDLRIEDVEIMKSWHED